MTVLFTAINAVLALVCTASIGYLLVLLTAASLPRRGKPAHAASRTGPPLRCAVVVPAHNEELVLNATLDSLAKQEYPTEAFEVVVIADNCTDSTAELARQSGGTVLERQNNQERGKGYALDWALQQLLDRPDAPDAYIIVDADTWVSPSFLNIMAQELQAHAAENGCCAAQGRYGVLNPGDGWRASLMAAALDLFNHIRPLGTDRLGWSVGLKGNGMGFTRQVLQQARWRGHSVTEDIDFGLDLLADHGIRVGYVPEARVLAQMPVTGEQAASQRERWEGGRYRLLRERFLPLVRAGLRRGDTRLLAAGLDLLTPPLAELGALLGLWAGMILLSSLAGWLPGSQHWVLGLCLSVSGLALYVFGGLRVAGAPRAAYRALLQAPLYLLWKLALYAAAQCKGAQPSGSPQWVRTERSPMPATAFAEEAAS